MVYIGWKETNRYRKSWYTLFASQMLINNTHVSTKNQISKTVIYGAYYLSPEKKTSINIYDLCVFAYIFVLQFI